MQCTVPKFLLIAIVAYLKIIILPQQYFYKNWLFMVTWWQDQKQGWHVMITGRSSDSNGSLWQGTNELVLSTNDYLIPSTFYVYLTPSFLSLLYHEQKYLTIYQISILNLIGWTCIVMISSFINIFCIFLAFPQQGVLSLILDFSSVAVDHTLFSSNKYFAFFKMTIFYLM